MPAKNRLLFIKKKEEMLRRKQEEREDRHRRFQSQKELRHLMSKSKRKNKYWHGEADETLENRYANVITIHESRAASRYLFPNKSYKSVETFLKANKSRVLKKLKINRKVIFNLNVTMLKFSPDPDEKPEEQIFHMPIPIKTLLTKKDILLSYKSLVSLI